MLMLLCFSAQLGMCFGFVFKSFLSTISNINGSTFAIMLWAFLFTCHEYFSLVIVLLPVTKLTEKNLSTRNLSKYT
jgi:hypothetical protein